MKTLMLVIACSCALLGAARTSAQDRPPLGGSHFAAEADVMLLQHRTFTTDDGGVYLGLSGYGHLGRDWYLGGEIGVGAGFGALFFESSAYTPFELNAKRAFALSPRWAADLGAGLSYSRVEYNYNPWGSSTDRDVDDWVFGGQVLADLYFRAGRLLLGLKLKYQLTADLPEVESLISPEEGWDYSNLKFGLQIGFLGSE